MKKITFTICVLLLLGSLQSQTVDNYLTFAPQWNYISSKDDVMSPLVYRGHHGSLRTGYKRINTKGTVNEVYGSFSMGYIHSDVYPEFNSRAFSSMGSLTYRHIRTVTDSAFSLPVTFKVGGALHNVVYGKDNLRFTNNAFLMDYSSSLGIAARLGKEFELFGRAFQAHINGSVALLNYVLRPSFANSSPEAQLSGDYSGLKAFWKSAELKTISDFQQIATGLSLRYHLQNGNAVRLSYRWRFTHYKDIAEMYRASHAISVSTHFKF